MDFIEHAYRLAQAGTPFVLATVVRAERPTSAKAGARGIVTADGTLAGWVGGSCAEPTVIREARRALADGEPRLLRLCPPEKMTGLKQPGVVETVLTCASGGTLEIYLEPHLAQPHLIVISHQPIAEALTTLGTGLGFAVTVAGMDARPERFPQARRVLADLEFGELGVTPNSYIVVASHGNYDEDALEWALRTDAAYVALVASPKRAASVRAYLVESGLSAAQLARLKAPAGLDLGAATPEEIALSVLAEVVQLRRKGATDDRRPTTEGVAGTQAALVLTEDEGRRTKDGEAGGGHVHHAREAGVHAHHEAHPLEAHEYMPDDHHEHAGHGQPVPPEHSDHAGHEHHDEHDHSTHAPSAAAQPGTAIDPVCGMVVEIAGARYTAEHAGQTYYFCCPGCRRTFQKDPAKYVTA
jgi:xanthine dehydrogenase accessory factor